MSSLPKDRLLVAWYVLMSLVRAFVLHFLLLTHSQSHPSDVGSLEPFQKVQPCQITSMPNHNHRHSNHATSQALVKYRDGLRISSVPSCAAEMIFARALCTCARPRAPHVCATVNALCLVPRSILRPCMISHKSLFLHSLTSKFSECWPVPLQTGQMCAAPSLGHA